MRILFSTIAKVLSTALSTFLDNFAARSNTTGGLGTATDGNPWKAVNGTINVVSGAATATSTPTTYSAGSSYPMSSVTMTKSNVQMKLKGTNPGSTAAIWITSADEWWGVATNQVQNTIPGNANYAYQYNIGNYWWSTGGPFSANYNYNYTYSYNYVSGQTYTRVAFFVYGFTSSTSFSITRYNVSYGASYGTRYNSKYAIAYNVYTWATYGITYSSSTTFGYKVNATYYAYNSANVDTPANATAVGTASYNYYNTDQAGPNYDLSTFQSGTNATTYSISSYVDIIKSTSSAVTTVSSILVSTTQTIASMIVSLLNNQITIKPYSDTNLVSQIGSDLVYTATGAVVTTQFGIAVSPSTYNQSATIATSAEINVV